MLSNRSRRISIIAFLAAAIVTAGCATPTDPAVTRLRGNFEQTAADATIVAGAPVALHEAEQAVERAEEAARAESEREEIDHLVYLAERRIEIARIEAQRKLLELEVERLADERHRVLLEARATEAEARAAEAAAARLEAEHARLEAEQRLADVAAAREEAHRLEAALEELKARQTPRGLVLTLGDVLFAFDRADLAPGAERVLDRLVTFLGEYPARDVIIEGHTDSIGDEGYNRILSERRAQAVERYLLDHGIASRRLVTRGYGKAFPVASNADEAGRQRNRRVEIVILEEGESPESRMR